MKKTFVALLAALITTAFCFAPAASARSLATETTTHITFSVKPGETVEVTPSLNYEVHNLCEAKTASYELSNAGNDSQSEYIELSGGESDFFSDRRFDLFANTSASCVEELVEAD